MIGAVGREPAMDSREFIAFVAACLVVGATATDMMLPALGAVGAELSHGDFTAGQSAIVAFLLGMGLPQLLFGSLTDRFGRRPVLLGGCATFVAGALLTALAQDIVMLVAARLLQGMGAGALRVATYAIVRDRHASQDMSRVMSLAMTVLLLEPIVSPLIGQLVLLVGSWRWISVLVAVPAAAVLIWGRARLDETLPVERRVRVSSASILSACREVATNQPAFMSALAYGLVMGGHVGFLSSAQVIFERTYDVGLGFTPLLALVSLATSAAAFLNSRLLVDHDSAALIRFALIAQLAWNTLAVSVARFGFTGLTEFLVLQVCNMFAFGLLAPNLTAMAMRPFGHVAGTAAAMFGLITNSLGACLGFAVGQASDGSVRVLFEAYWILTAAAWLALKWATYRTTYSIDGLPPVQR